MSGQRDFWLVRLASAVEADLDQILQWTAEHFGEEQADSYAETLMAAVDALKAGPTTAGVKARSDLPEGILTLYAARLGRKARHVILFRAERERGRKTIQVLRILHDAMDFPRHLADEEADH
ncbi:MAG: type II toxin-antitoxin system RelE/ParE family toxin [Magnetospirillum sp. WYHS-4]